MTDVATMPAARIRAERIRLGIHSYVTTMRDIADAYRERDWDALGYESYESYVDAEFSQARLRLSAEDRREAVLKLRLDGMSQRAIGSTLGVSVATVNRDLGTVPNETVPDRITGTDGREQPATRRAQSPGPSDAAEPPPVDPGTTTEPADPGIDQPRPGIAAATVEVLAGAVAFDRAVGEFPELEHYRDRPTKAVALADQLRSFDPAERNSRRETLAKVIAAEKGGRLTPKPDPAADAIALADRLFVAVNEAAQVAEKVGGVRAMAAAVAHADPMQIELWRDQFTELAELCKQIADACRPQLRRVQ